MRRLPRSRRRSNATPALKAANARDVARARDKGLDAAFVDRLTLSDKAIATMIEGLRQIARWPTRSARSATSSTAP